MQRRRQLTASASSTQANCSIIEDQNQDSQTEAPRSPSASSSLQSFLTGSPSSSSGPKKDVPLFTFKYKHFKQDPLDYENRGVSAFDFVTDISM